MHPPPELRTDHLHGAQAAFADALWAGAPPAGLSAPQPDEVARRFGVYRNNVMHGLSRALERRFPVIARLVGSEFFAALARSFAAAHPPRSPVLIDWGDAFADFLARFPPLAQLPYLPDVARLEFARGSAYHAADAAPAPAEALVTEDPGRLHLRLHPSVHLIASPWPVLTIWRANQAGRPPARIPAHHREHALIARTRALEVIVEPLDAPSHAVLSALQRGTRLAEAAGPDDPAAALTLLLRHQLITHIGATP